MNRKRWLSKLTTLVLCMILTVVMTACGSGSGSSSSGGQGGTSGSAQTSGSGQTSGSQGGSGQSSGTQSETIKIGAPFPLTGAWAEGGQNSLNGVELGIEDINAAGGIQALGGAKLELVSADTGSSDPNQAASVTRRLVEEKVSALIGSYVSAFSLTATTEAEKAKIPMITQSFVDSLTERGYKYTFQIPPKSSAFGTNSVTYMVELIEQNNLGIKKVAFVANNDANSIGSIESGQKAAQEAGMEVVLTETFPPGITDATPIITKIRNTQPELIFMAGVLQDQILIIRAMRSQGIEAPVVGMGGGGFLGKGFAEALGEYSDYAFSLAAWNWDLKYPGVEDVNKRYMERYNAPFMPQEAGESYIAAWLIKEAIEAAGSADPEKIREQLSSLNFDTGAGAMMTGGKVKFDETGMNAGVYPVMIEWLNGLPHTVWPANEKVMDAVLK